MLTRDHLWLCTIGFGHESSEAEPEEVVDRMALQDVESISSARQVQEANSFAARVKRS